MTSAPLRMRSRVRSASRSIRSQPGEVRHPERRSHGRRRPRGRAHGGRRGTGARAPGPAPGGRPALGRRGAGDRPRREAPPARARSGSRRPGSPRGRSPSRRSSRRGSASGNPPHAEERSRRHDRFAVAFAHSTTLSDVVQRGRPSCRACESNCSVLPCWPWSGSGRWCSSSFDPDWRPAPTPSTSPPR